MYRWLLKAKLLAVCLLVLAGTYFGATENGSVLLYPQEAHEGQTEPAALEAPAESAAQPEPEPYHLVLVSIPEYTGAPFAQINGNTPFFTEEDRNRGCFETYSELDSMGRCGPAFALVGLETMPTEPRGEIGQVKPSGWHTVRYDDIIKDKYLYNRCHLIGFQLTGENANEKNLITGTRYMNVEGMLPFENLTAEYVEDTGNHVLYRATPIFKGNDLVCRGVLLEGMSVEEDDVRFCVFCHNVQPGIEIDYATGESNAIPDAYPGKQG